MRKGGLFAFFAMTIACGSAMNGSHDLIRSDANSDAGVFEDSSDGAQVFVDARPEGDAALPSDAILVEDATFGSDARRGDSGTLPGPAIYPGRSIVFVEGEVLIGQNFSRTKSVLGVAARRSPEPGSRSYAFSLPNNVEATVWFRNSNLDANDDAPNDVDPTDTALWVSVSGSNYLGRTSAGIGIGSTRTLVEQAYGPSPHVVTLESPRRSVATYYKRGFIATYDTNERVVAFAVCTTYLRDPDGQLDVVGGRIRFGQGNDLTTGSALGGGDSTRDVRGLLGEADVEGNVVLSQATMRLYSYSFIGIEVFFSPVTTTAFFVSIHAPYYGPLMGTTLGIGTARADFEAFLYTNNFAPGVVSASQPALVCYKLNTANRAVGASYSNEQPQRVTSIVVGLPLSQNNTCQ